MRGSREKTGLGASKRGTGKVCGLASRAAEVPGEASDAGVFCCPPGSGTVTARLGLCEEAGRWRGALLHTSLSGTLDSLPWSPPSGAWKRLNQQHLLLGSVE